MRGQPLSHELGVALGQRVDDARALEPGRVDGWASYRVQQQWPEGLPANVVRVRMLVGLTPEADAAGLDAAGCDRAQGYFIGRPMPGTALEVDHLVGAGVVGVGAVGAVTTSRVIRRLSRGIPRASSASST